MTSKIIGAINFFQVFYIFRLRWQYLIMIMMIFIIIIISNIFSILIHYRSCTIHRRMNWSLDKYKMLFYTLWTDKKYQEDDISLICIDAWLKPNKEKKICMASNVSCRSMYSRSQTRQNQSLMFDCVCVCLYMYAWDTSNFR